MTPRRALLKLINQKCHRYQPADPFTLASGEKSPHYVNLRALVADPKHRHELARMLAGAGVLHDVGNIAGVPLGGVALATEVSTILQLPLILVRKEAKKHGTGQRVEAPWGDQLPYGGKPYPALLVEDVVTSGASVVDTVRALNDAHVPVAAVVAVVDREAGGREAIERAGTKFHALFTLNEIIDQTQRDHP